VVKKLIATAALSALIMFAAMPAAHAAPAPAPTGNEQTKAESLHPGTHKCYKNEGLNQFFGMKPWYAEMYCDDKEQPQLRSLNDVILIIFPVLDWLVKTAMFVTAGLIFYRLFQMILARGNSQKTGKASEEIRDAIIGFIICLIAVPILNFVAGAFS